MEYWTTREGKQIRICGMTTQHIKNCLRMIERGVWNNDKKEKYESLLQELRSRGEQFLPVYIEDSEVCRWGMFDSWEDD